MLNWPIPNLSTARPSAARAEAAVGVVLVALGCPVVCPLEGASAAHPLRGTQALPPPHNAAGDSASTGPANDQRAR